MADLSLQDVQRLAELAKLSLSEEEKIKLSKELSMTIKVIEVLNEIDTSGVTPSSQVTGLVNVLREDDIDMERVLIQSQALSGAKRTYKGYFVVNRIIE